ncbi:MAG TPA: hypothetical protein VFL42_00050 [Terriglobales bacterium]|nr:hypothetical protein [Terriglobales bacterium]
MLRKSCQLVVAALLLMAVLTPVMQLDSWDKFPVSSDDIEIAVTICLCILGMGLVFTRILKTTPTLLRLLFQVPMLSRIASSSRESNPIISAKPLSDTPLRI